MRKCCQRCGYLSLHKGDEANLAVVPPTLRQESIDPKTWSAFNGGNPFPACSVGAYPLFKELTVFEPAEMVRVVTKDRSECKDFVELVGGLSPKEHREMTLSQEVQERLQKFQEEQKKQDREWQSERDQKQYRRDVIKTIIGLLCTIVAGIATAIIAKHVGK